MTAAENIVSPAALLSEKFWGLKRSRIRLAPAHTTRASSIGNECERALVYERTHGELKTLHSPETQALFDLGIHAERYVISELGEMGFDVLERSRDYYDRNRELTGHIDGKLSGHGLNAVPIEIKGLNPYTVEHIQSIGDIRDSRQAWVRKYYAQLQTYLELGKEPMGLFVLLNKVSGAISFIDCPTDAEFGAAMLAKAERIRDAVKAGALPDRHRSEECGRCPFAHVCLPDVSFGPGVSVLDAPELAGAIAEREKHRAAHQAFEAADKALKALLPKEPGEFLVGDFALAGSKVERKAYQAKASSYVQWKATPLTKEQK
jgi:hypothetical protein